MPLFNPPPTRLEDFVLIENDITVDSGTVRFFPDFELAVDATLEIPVDAGAEVL